MRHARRPHPCAPLLARRLQCATPGSPSGRCVLVRSTPAAMVDHPPINVEEVVAHRVHVAVHATVMDSPLASTTSMSSGTSPASSGLTPCILDDRARANSAGVVLVSLRAPSVERAQNRRGVVEHLLSLLHSCRWRARPLTFVLNRPRPSSCHVHASCTSASVELGIPPA